MIDEQPMQRIGGSTSGRHAASLSKFPMSVSPDALTVREKSILTGLFLSKFDAAGLKTLGFESFVEAFNVIGYALGARPASIKNYRDEFDPFFSNPRNGWHKRSLRDYCRRVMETNAQLDLADFGELIKSFAGYNANTWSGVIGQDELDTQDSTFAKRLMTGVAAERYFEKILPDLEEFRGLTSENTTLQGCGYDFRLRAGRSDDYLVVEVKGIQDKSGGVSLTPKEYETAHVLSDRFYLFVVKNFRETPFHVIHRNPMQAGLRFSRTERRVVQVSWTGAV
jgi:hypothetical protein